MRPGAATLSRISHLAVLLEEWDGKESFQRAAIDLLKRAAEQRQPHAMYILGLHYRHGNGVEREPSAPLSCSARQRKTGSSLRRSKLATL